MLYQAYQAYADVMDPLRFFARNTAALLAAPPAWPWLPERAHQYDVSAAYEVFARTGLTYKRPSFDIPSITMNGEEVNVREEAAFRTPFGTLLHFAKDTQVAQPRVMIVAPMSGHFATLLRGTVLTMLPDHDVYITDWHNARDIPVGDGRFGLDGYIEHLMKFLEFLGPGAHMVAVCQPTVAALAAAALMAEDNHPAQPRTMTLMAGPIDCRVNPTKVNELAMSKPIEWFESRLIGMVPLRYAGGMRRVYPGFVQIMSFMSMNAERHSQAFIDMFNHLWSRNPEKAKSIMEFYEEYLAVSDLPAEFYLETVQKVFQEYALPLGKLDFRGHKIDPAAIRRTALMTVEGERDDICALGQTLAAQDLCSNIRINRKLHHVQAGVGHYGVFNGRRWQNEIYPMLRDFIHMHA
jgi:polyhydroxyalkanoate depolymerase